MNKNSLNLSDIQNVVNTFCKNNSLTINFKTEMPEGYETSNGTFDITSNTLYFNFSIMNDYPSFEILFYLYHELRHVLQYKKKSLFSDIIIKSLNYVLMYNGVCYKLIGDNWYEAQICGNEEYLISAYLGQPYEHDANNFAYENVKQVCGDSSELMKLYNYFLPKLQLSEEDYNNIYADIDNQIKNSNKDNK